MREIQVEGNHEGDNNFEDGDLRVELEIEEDDEGDGSHNLKDVEPEVAAVDSEVDQVVISLLGVVFH